MSSKPTNPVQTYERGLRFRFQNAATGARYGRRRGARRAHCSCRDHGHRPAAGREELTAAAHAWATFR